MAVGAACGYNLIRLVSTRGSQQVPESNLGGCSDVASADESQGPG